MNTTLPKLTLRSATLDAHALVQALAGFCEEFSDYCFLLEQSIAYQNVAHMEACVLLDTQAVTPTTLTFVETVPHTMQLEHLISKRVASLSRLEANGIVERFASCFSKFFRGLYPQSPLVLTFVPLPAEGGQTV